MKSAEKNPTMQFLLHIYIYGYGFGYIYVYKYIYIVIILFPCFFQAQFQGIRQGTHVVGGGKEEMEGEETAAVHSSSHLTPIFYTDGMHPVTVSTI